ADVTLIALVDRIGQRMRRAGRVGRTVVLRLRFDDYSRATRSRTLTYATAHTRTLLSTARSLLAAATPLIELRGLTLVGLAVANLDDGGALQLSLPLEGPGDELDRAIDQIRRRVRAQDS